MSESTLVTGALQLLTVFGIESWRNQAGAAEVVRRSKKKTYTNWMRFGKKGSSDIIGITPTGQFLAIECKRPGEKLRPEQKDFLAMVNNKGGVAWVIYTVDELQNKLETAIW